MSLAITKINPAFVDVMPQEYMDLAADGPFAANKSTKDLGTFKELIEDHPLCAGCNLAMAFRTLISALPCPEDTVIVGSTGCNSLAFPQLAIHNVHALFGNQNAVASGLKRGLKLRFPDKNKDVVVMAGDGATADIGFDMTLHSWIRGENITTVMFDNELYANTGGQESGMTQFSEVRAMAPTGKKFQKMNVPEFAKQAGCVYVAKVSTANTLKIGQCFRKAVLIAREIGPTYIQIYTPCPTNLKMKPADSVALAKKRAKEDYAFFEYMSEEAENLLVSSGEIKPKIKKETA